MRRNGLLENEIKARRHSASTTYTNTRRCTRVHHQPTTLPVSTRTNDKIVGQLVLDRGQQIVEGRGGGTGAIAILVAQKFDKS